MRRYLQGLIVGVLFICTIALAESLYSGLEQFSEKAKALTKETLPAIEKAAGSGDANAKVVLGFAYLQGNAGLPIEYKTAAKHFENSANEGNVYGQLMIGTILLEGKGVEVNGPKAVSWLQKAAENNNAEAAYLLGNIHLGFINAPGVKLDLVEAYKWLTIATELTTNQSKNESFLLSLRVAEKKMTKAQVESGRRLAENWISAHLRSN